MTATKIVGAITGSFVVSWAFWHAARNMKVFGGTVPPTLNAEWAAETSKRLDSWPREAGAPVVMNPVLRQNYQRE
eukprot:jgi/Mesen1/4845/ME000244S04016